MDDRGLDELYVIRHFHYYGTLDDKLEWNQPDEVDFETEISH